MNTNIRLERWVFSRKEVVQFGNILHARKHKLPEPEYHAVYGEEQMSVTVRTDDMEDNNEPEAVDTIFVCRNGKITNRWGDGTAGVPVHLQQLADSQETYFRGTEIFDTWLDVYSSDEGFVGFTHGSEEIIEKVASAYRK